MVGQYTFGILLTIDVCGGPYHPKKAIKKQMNIAVSLHSQLFAYRRHVNVNPIVVLLRRGRSWKRTIDEQRRVFWFAFQVFFQLGSILKIDGVFDMPQVIEGIFPLVPELILWP